MVKTDVEDLTALLVSHSSAPPQPFRSCAEKEQGVLECVSPCEVPDVISACVRGWNVEARPWLENVLIGGCLQVTPAKLQPPALSRLEMQ